LKKEHELNNFLIGDGEYSHRQFCPLTLNQSKFMRQKGVNPKYYRKDY
jgi:hypothetical protein